MNPRPGHPASNLCRIDLAGQVQPASYERSHRQLITDLENLKRNSLENYLVSRRLTHEVNALKQQQRSMEVKLQTLSADASQTSQCVIL